MPLIEHAKKGLARCLIDSRLEGEPLHFHISEVAAGQRSHPPHTHDGVEAIYVMAGEATVEFPDESVRLVVGESIIFDPRRLHGLINTGAGPNRYMVIIRP